MNYDSQIKKLLKILERENQNTNDIASINQDNLTLSPDSFNKKTVIFNLFVGYDFQHGIFDPSANNKQGGYINPKVKILRGGPNQIGI